MASHDNSFVSAVKVEDPAIAKEKQAQEAREAREREISTISSFMKDYTMNFNAGKPQSDITFSLMKQQVVNEVKFEMSKGMGGGGAGQGKAPKLAVLATVVGIVTSIIIAAVLIYGLKLNGKMMEQSNAAKENKQIAKKVGEMLSDPVKLNEAFSLYNRTLPSKSAAKRYMDFDDEFDGITANLMMRYFAEEDGKKDVNMSSPMRNLLLYGPPGTGKTSFAEHLLYMLAKNIKIGQLMRLYEFTTPEAVLADPALAQQLGDLDDVAEMYSIGGETFYDMYYGGTEGNLKVFLDFVAERQKERMVFVFIDEAEVTLVSRGDVGPHHVSKNMSATFLKVLDGIGNKDQTRIMYIAATNFFSLLDKALKRRFGLRIGMPLPNRERRNNYMKAPLKELGEPMTKDQWEEILEATKGLSLGEIQNKINALGQNFSISNKASFEEILSYVNDPTIEGETDKDEKKNPNKEKMTVVTEKKSTIKLNRSAVLTKYLPLPKGKLHETAESDDDSGYEDSDYASDEEEKYSNEDDAAGDKTVKWPVRLAGLFRSLVEEKK